jgi:hypothetical protein
MWTEPRAWGVRLTEVSASRWKLVTAAALALAAISGCGGGSSATVSIGSPQVASPKPCPSVFQLSLISSRNGQATPMAAAVWFATRGGVANVPVSGWRPVSQTRGRAVLASGRSTVHVIEGPDGTWQVDSGHNCG